MPEIRTTDRRGVTNDNPFPTFMPKYENVNGLLSLTVDDFDSLMDVLERIQQQLGQINNNNNLDPGERFE